MEENRYAITIGVGIFMAILATTAVLLRFAARHVRKVSFQADDYTIVAALICLFGQCICNLVGAIAGKMGTHYAIETADSPEVVLNKFVLRSKVIWSLNILCTLGPGLTRTSILLLYRRIFVGQVFAITTWTVFGLNTVWTVGFFFGNLLSCVPVSNIWATGTRSGTCVDFYILFKSMVVSGVILDGLVLTLPWHPVWKLNMPTRRKVVVSGIFLLGAFVVISSIFRVVSMFDALVPNKDTTWTRAPAFYWATIETGIGIVSACLPTMRPLISKSGPGSIIQSVQRKLRGSFSRSKLSQDSSSFNHRSSEESKIVKKSVSIPRDEKAYVFDGAPSWTYQHQTRVEVTEAENLPRPSDGIVVESSVSHASRSHDMV